MNDWTGWHFRTKAGISGERHSHIRTKAARLGQVSEKPIHTDMEPILEVHRRAGVYSILAISSKGSAARAIRIVSLGSVCEIWRVLPSKYEIAGERAEVGVLTAASTFGMGKSTSVFDHEPYQLDDLVPK